MKSKLSEKRQDPRPKVVVDTSVLISATLVDGAFRKLIRQLLNSDFEICIPLEVIEEYEKIVAQPKFKKYEPLFIQIFEEIKKSSMILPAATKKKHTIERSPEDENIINSCVENHIDFLITFDKNTVGKYNGLEVLIAADFYTRFLAN